MARIKNGHLRHKRSGDQHPKELKKRVRSGRFFLKMAEFTANRLRRQQEAKA